MDSSKFLVAPGAAVRLRDFDPDEKGRYDGKKEATEETADNLAALTAAQEVLYAQGKHALLVVLQAMDAGGKIARSAM